MLPGLTVFCLLRKELPVILVAFEVWTRKLEIQKSQRERVDWSGKTIIANCKCNYACKCDILSENERPPLALAFYNKLKDIL